MLRYHHFPALLMAACMPCTALADERTASALIRVPMSVSTVFIAETSTASFHRFERVADTMVHQGAVYMSVGQAGVGKRRSGDKRTPLGVYFVTEELDTSRLHEKYGVTAYPLDYPNAWDQRLQRSGDGIWVHGVDPRAGKRPQRDTDGCLALQNGDLMSLRTNFEDNVTPVLVVQSIAWGDAARSAVLRAELESVVANWVSSKASGDLHAYLSSYDEDFRRWGMNKAEWFSFSVQTAATGAETSASISELLLLEYPEEDGVYLSRFRLRAISNESTREMTKRLYWRRDEHGTLKIVTEDEG